jgi:prepilin-type processing-associated H-X9-DG protein
MRLKRAGFTLIEVCVSCLIIALLAGLLSAVGIRGVRAAKESVCAQHLHQLELAWSVYETDHDQWSPPLPRYDNWAIRMRGDEAFSLAITPYLGAREVRYCPLDIYAGKLRVAEGAYFPPVFLSYNVGFHVFVTYTVRPQVLGQGFAYLNRGAVPNQAEHDLMEDQSEVIIGETGEQWLVSSHGPYANAVFVDGHLGRLWFPRP